MKHLLWLFFPPCCDLWKKRRLEASQAHMSPDVLEALTVFLPVVPGGSKFHEAAPP